LSRGQETVNELALFAGAGGGILGGLLLGWRTVCAVEIDEYARDILLARQDDGSLDPFPVWDDVQTFDGTEWRGIVDVVSGGFPCQDISSANNNAEGIAGEKSGLWSEMARIISEVGPRYAFMENVTMLTSRGLGTVLGDLAEMGFDAECGVLGAHQAGAPHRRDRIWIVAYHPDRHREPDVRFNEKAPWMRSDPEESQGPCESYWSREVEPPVVRVDDGVASRVDRLRCIGNGQVPAVAALAFTELSKRLASNGRR